MLCYFPTLRVAWPDSWIGPSWNRLGPSWRPFWVGCFGGHFGGHLGLSSVRAKGAPNWDRHDSCEGRADLGTTIKICRHGPRSARWPRRTGIALPACHDSCEGRADLGNLQQNSEQNQKAKSDHQTLSTTSNFGNQNHDNMQARRAQIRSPSPRAKIRVRGAPISEIYNKTQHKTQQIKIISSNMEHNKQVWQTKP